MHTNSGSSWTTNLPVTSSGKIRLTFSQKEYILAKNVLLLSSHRQPQCEDRTLCFKEESKKLIYI